MTSDQTEPRPWSRLKRLWSDLLDRIDLWSDRTQTMVLTKKTMIRSSRLNWPLIRPNPDHGPGYEDCDQTFQTELTYDQTEPRPWSRLKRLWSDLLDRIDLWSDRTQTMVLTKKTMIRPSRPNWPLIRPNPDHGPGYEDCDQTFQTELTYDQTEPRPWSRLKRLWSDLLDRIDLWSDRTQTMVQTKKTMIRPSRPNWPLIRPSPDHGPD